MKTCIFTIFRWLVWDFLITWFVFSRPIRLFWASSRRRPGSTASETSDAPQGMYYYVAHNVCMLYYLLSATQWIPTCVGMTYTRTPRPLFELCTLKPEHLKKIRHMLPDIFLTTTERNLLFIFCNHFIYLCR